MADAQAAYVQSMLGAFNGNVAAFHDYMMLDRKVYQEMGQINAEAIKGLQPKMSVWTTGNGDWSDSAGSAAKPIADIYRMIPPLLTTIRDQTGVGQESMPPLSILSAPALAPTKTS